MTFPVRIKIENFDWKIIRKLHQVMLDKQSRREYSSFNPHDYGGDPRYDFAGLGSLIYGDQLSINWGTMCGPLFESKLPWIDTVRDYFSGLNFHGVLWSKTYGNVAKHMDVPNINEENKSQCKINYIVSAVDLNAVTKVYDPNNENIEESYPSIPGQAFLLDVNCPHEVLCDGEREVLQFKFFESFNTVKNFLADKPELWLK